MGSYFVDFLFLSTFSGTFDTCVVARYVYELNLLPCFFSKGVLVSYYMEKVKR